MNIEQQLLPLFEEADKLMKKIEEEKVPTFEILVRFITRISAYPHKYAVTLIITERWRRHYIQLSPSTWSSEVSLTINDKSWEKASYHDQAVLVYALPKLLKEFIKAVRHHHLFLPGSLRIKKIWWKRG